MASDPAQARSAFSLIMMGKPISSQSPGELRGTQLALQHVTELAPKFAPPYAELALVEARIGAMQQAYKDARQAEALEPSRAGYHLLTGRVLLLGKQPKVAANFSRFVAARWYGPDHNEAVDLWQSVPLADRGDGPELTLDLPAGVQVARGTVVAVSCGTGPDAKLNVTFQPAMPSGAKPLTFASDGRMMIGFSDTLWWGEDHFNRCYHLSGHPGVVAYKPQGTDGGQLLDLEVRDDFPASPETPVPEEAEAQSSHR